MININIKNGKVAASENAAKKINSNDTIDPLPEGKVTIIQHETPTQASSDHSYNVKMDLDNSHVQVEKDSKLAIELNGSNNRLTEISRPGEIIKQRQIQLKAKISKGIPTNRNFNHLSCHDQGAPLSIVSGQDYREVLLKNFATHTVDYDLVIVYVMAELAELHLFSALQSASKLNTFFPGYMDGDYWCCSNVRIKKDEPYGSPDLVESNWTRRSNYPDLSLLELQPLRCKLVAAYARINSLRFDTAVSTLLERLEVDPQNCLASLFNPELTALKTANNFSIVNPLPSSFEKLIFLSKNRGINNICVATSFDGKNFLFPCTNLIRSSDHEHSTFHVMTKTNLSLFNLDKIAANSHTEIILTSNLLLAHKFKELDDAIVTSWFGANYTYKQIDFVPIEGRKLLYLYDGSEEELGMALKLFALFEKKKKITMKVLAKDSENCFVKMTKFHFLKHAKKCGTYIPKNLRKYLKTINTLPTKKVKIPFVIVPIIFEGDFVIIYAPSDTGKTWLALAIGIALATGKDVFGQWKVRRPQKTMYIAGEMSEASITNRLVDINRVYERTEDNGNFVFEPVRDVDISSKAGQKEIEDLLEKHPGTKVVILDNLVTLSKGATYEANWDKIVKWKQTMLKDVTVIMIHHTNKEGKYRGSSDLKNKSDFMIELQNHEQFLEYTARNSKRTSVAKAGTELEKLYGKVDDANITLYIDTEKHREVSKSDAPFFRAELNPKSENPRWITTPIDLKKYHGILANGCDDDAEVDSTTETKFSKWSESEQKLKILELLKAGYNIEEMCKELDCKKTTLCKIRKKTLTRDCDLAEITGGSKDDV